MIPGTTSSQGKFVDPPTSVSASAGNGQATVSFTVPVYHGKGTGNFVVTSSPGGFSASGASSPIAVTGLSNGTAYTFTVEARGGYGVDRASGASNSVSPVAPTTTTTTTTTTTAAPTTTTTAAPTTAAPCVPGCTPACGTATFAGATVCGGSTCCGCGSGCPGCWEGHRAWNLDCYTYSQQSCVDACGITRYNTCSSFCVDSTVASSCCAGQF